MSHDRSDTHEDNHRLLSNHCLIRAFTYQQAQECSLERHRWVPLVFQDVEADGANRAADVRVPNLQGRMEGGSVKRGYDVTLITIVGPPGFPPW